MSLAGRIAWRDGARFIGQRFAYLPKANVRFAHAFLCTVQNIVPFRTLATRKGGALKDSIILAKKATGGRSTAKQSKSRKIDAKHGQKSIMATTKANKSKSKSAGIRKRLKKSLPLKIAMPDTHSDSKTVDSVKETHISSTPLSDGSSMTRTPAMGDAVTAKHTNAKGPDGALKWNHVDDEVSSAQADRKRERKRTLIWAAAALAVFSPAFYRLYMDHNHPQTETTVPIQEAQNPTQESSDAAAEEWEAFLAALAGDSSDERSIKCTYLIVGGGPAGHAALEQLAAADPGAQVVLVSAENHLPYARPPLSKSAWDRTWPPAEVPGASLYFNAGKKADSGDNDLAKSNERNHKSTVELGNMTASTDTHKRENALAHSLALPNINSDDVSVLLGTRVDRIDVFRRVAHLSDGREIHFKSVLLATGARPVVPAVFGNALAESRRLSFEHAHTACGSDENRGLSNEAQVADPLVTTLRTVEDFTAIQNRIYSVPPPRVAVVGSDVLAVEVAYRIANTGKASSVDLFVSDTPAVLSRVLPLYLATWATDRLAATGVNVLANSAVARASIVRSLSTEGNELSETTSVPTPSGIGRPSMVHKLRDALAAWLSGGEHAQRGCIARTLEAGPREVAVETVDGTSRRFDIVIVAAGASPDTTHLAPASALPVDKETGGFAADADLHVCKGVIYAAGDAASVAIDAQLVSSVFGETYIGNSSATESEYRAEAAAMDSPSNDIVRRMRLDGYGHALQSGRLAARNMTRSRDNAETYDPRKAMYFATKIGDVVRLDGVGIIDARLTNVGIWSRDIESDTERYAHGAVVYLDNTGTAVGILLIGRSERMPAARAILSDRLDDLQAIADRLAVI